MQQWAVFAGFLHLPVCSAAFCQLSLLLECVTHTQKQRDNVQLCRNFPRFVLRLSKKRQFRPSAQTNATDTSRCLLLRQKCLLRWRKCRSPSLSLFLFSTSASFCLTSFLQKLSTCLFTNVKKKSVVFKKYIYLYFYLWNCATLFPHSETCSPLASSSGT